MRFISDQLPAVGLNLTAASRVITLDLAWSEVRPPSSFLFLHARPLTSVFFKGCRDASHRSCLPPRPKVGRHRATSHRQGHDCELPFPPPQSLPSRTYLHLFISQEERILKLQERKVFYSDGALNEGQFKGGANRNALSIPELLSVRSSLVPSYFLGS